MTIRFFDSPFHVTHDEEIANKMAGEVELSIVTVGSQKPSIEENEARISRGALTHGFPNLRAGEALKLSPHATT